MEGEYHITVWNRRLHYELTVRRSLTLIRGDSGTGKTLLIRMIEQASTLGAASGVNVICPLPCSTLRESDWSLTLPNTHGHIIFLDTDYQFVRSKEFAAAVQTSDNYFVIVSREDLPHLPYSEEEIYEIQTTGKEHELRRFHGVPQGSGRAGS